MLDAPGTDDQGPEGAGPDGQQLAPWPYGSGQPAADGARASSNSAGEDTVTLIFKDGRPAEKIHNYILTGTTLYVNHHADIPVDELDLAATMKVNRDAGVDFHLPVSAAPSAGFVAN